ncbi:hypothetical protein KAS24_06550, partial [Candidatus Bathyarchaeota archaeon]|nr:hypothetical protein [Candidatus Bathyarchaeota archaeon]
MVKFFDPEISVASSTLPTRNSRFMKSLNGISIQVTNDPSIKTPKILNFLSSLTRMEYNESFNGP